MIKKGVYCGSFDPITFGHECVINGAAKMLDLTVLVANNPQKKHVFSIEERLDLVRKSVPSTVKTDIMNHGLLTEYCKINEIEVIVRGLRSVNDLEYELQIANANLDLDSSIQTIFVPAPAPLNYVSSSMVKEIAKLGGKYSKYVNASVESALKNKL